MLGARARPLTPAARSLAWAASWWLRSLFHPPPGPLQRRLLEERLGAPVGRLLGAQVPAKPESQRQLRRADAGPGASRHSNDSRGGITFAGLCTPARTETPGHQPGEAGIKGGVESWAASGTERLGAGCQTLGGLTGKGSGIRHAEWTGC